MKKRRDDKRSDQATRTDDAMSVLQGLWLSGECVKLDRAAFRDIFRTAPKVPNTKKTRVIHYKHRITSL